MTQNVVYSNSDHESIATALDVCVARVVELAKTFEWSAYWYRQDNGPLPKSRKPAEKLRPSELQDQLLQISDAAARLLAHLGIDNGEEACDGPGIPQVLDALDAASHAGAEDRMGAACDRIALLMKIVESACAAIELRENSRRAIENTAFISKVTVPKGFQGDRALNDWIAIMLSVYRHLTGVDASRPLERDYSAKLYRFLESAGRPLEIECSRQQWKDRVATVVGRQADDDPSAWDNIDLSNVECPLLRTKKGPRTR